ncbi:MAG: ABC transporter permease [Dictyoglomi bacterium]|nr:ABC transporter permease [Dictyoglomota bacterium]
MWRKVWSVVKKELKDLFREKRTIFMTIILPAILMPALLIGMFYFQTSTSKKEEVQAKTVAIQVGDTLAKHYAEILKKEKIIENYIEVDDIGKAIKDGKALTGFKIEPKGDSIIIETYYNVEKASGSQKIQAIANIIKEMYVAEYLQKHGLPPVNTLTQIKTTPIGDPLAMVKAMTGYLLGLFLVMFTTIGNTYLGADIGAGEKERGTLLPLLSSPADRKSIATGKWVALTITNLISATALLAGEGFAIWYVIKQSASIAQKNFDIGMIGKFISPSTMVMLFLAAVLLALFGAALQLIISMWSKTLREAQLYLSQLGLLVFLPAMAIIPTMISGGKLAMWAFYIPIVNTMALVYGAVMGQLTTLNVIVAFGANILVAAVVIGIVVKILDMEQVILRT